MYHPPLEHQGNWYWDNGAFAQMRADAIAAADPDINFLQFDLNHDGEIAANELIINICAPQLTPDGQAGQFASIKSRERPSESPPSIATCRQIWRTGGIVSGSSVTRLGTKRASRHGTFTALRRCRGHCH